MSVLISQRYIFFNSSSSSSYIQEPTSLSCFIDPTTFQINEPGVYYRYFISSLQFRNDFQNINTQNNQMVYNGSTTIYLPVGKPDIQDIITYLSTVGITVSYNDFTNYITFSTTSPYTLDFTGTFNCATLLGFDSGYIYTITDGFQPPNQINLTIDTVFINSNYSDMNYAVVNDMTQYTSTLGSVSLLANPYQLLEFVDATGQYSSIERTRTDIQSITLSFTNSSGVPLTLNSNFSCNLCIQYLRDYQPDIIKEIQLLREVVTQQFIFQKRESMLNHLKKQAPKTIKKK